MLKYEEQTGIILNACMEVHKELGNGFLEPVYQEALEEEFKLQNIPYQREKLLPVMYKGKKLNKEYFADFVCYENIVVELKSVAKLAKPHKAQVLNYLNAANLEIGLLVNFGETSLKWERITNFTNQELLSQFRIRVAILPPPDLLQDFLVPEGTGAFGGCPEVVESA